MITYTATYSPEDNKLRLSASSRLDAETYARVRAAGFIWAPKQGIFVAPMWTPERAALAEELAGEIDDEDTSLVERAEERAGRFDEYSDKRHTDAERAAEGVRRIADGIPLGQPILIGHHSEKHARRDAERIESGMRKAVKMWETSKYWTDRAAGALAHAKYKERPDVRARRIKGLEADERKQKKNVAAASANLRIWENIHDDALTTLKRKDGVPTTFAERALYASGRMNTTTYGVYSDLTSGKITPEEAQRISVENSRKMLDWCSQWLTHIAGRLAYERAMMAECGGTVADKVGPEVGGGCRCWASPRHARAWSYIKKVNKVSATVLDNWGNGGRDFTRTIPFDKLQAVMSRAEVDAARTEGRLIEIGEQGFALKDAPPPVVRETEAEKPTDFDAMKASLKAGVTVAAVNQLFPTPRALAERMIERAAIEPGQRVLEPSAGTGMILGAMGGRMFGHEPERGEVVAVEIHAPLANRLRAEFPLTDVRCADFLQCNGDFGKFDRIIMNPPFEGAADIKHILHARKFLKPGGRIVAICANGPRQGAILGEIADSWEPLPADTFAGTSVNAALIEISAEEGGSHDYAT